MGNSDVLLLQVWLEPLCVLVDVDTTTSHTQARVRESFLTRAPILHNLAVCKLVRRRR